MASAIGAVVVVTSSSQKKIDLACEVGALGGVSYKDPLWPYKAMQLLPKDRQVQHPELRIPSTQMQTLSCQDGFDLVVDGAGGLGFGSIHVLCSKKARVVFFGGTAGNWPNLNPKPLFMKEIELIGTGMGVKLNQVLEFFEVHQLKPLVSDCFAMSKVCSYIYMTISC